MNRQTCRDAVVADSGAVYTPGISERRGSASRFYHGDIKNFVEQTDSSGQIVSSKQYDAFGNPVSSTGTWSGPFAYGGRFGSQSDSDLSLSLLGHRYYDPTTGRFLSRDPIGDGRNWYVYSKGNPLAYSDPTGLKIVISDEFTPEERRLLEGHFNELKRNPASRQLVKELIDHPHEIRIHPRRSKFDHPDHDGIGPHFEGPKMTFPGSDRLPPGSNLAPEPVVGSGVSRIFFDPDETIVRRRGGPLPHPEAAPGTNLDVELPPVVVLAHELGHAYGYRDNQGETGEPGDNVRRVENPLRKTLGLRERILY